MTRPLPRDPGQRVPDPFDTGQRTTPEDAWALTPGEVQIGEHLYERRAWLPVGQQVGRHLVERCCGEGAA